jgi:hypothetical protein
VLELGDEYRFVVVKYGFVQIHQKAASVILQQRYFMLQLRSIASGKASQPSNSYLDFRCWVDAHGSQKTLT